MQKTRERHDSQILADRWSERILMATELSINLYSVTICKQTLLYYGKPRSVQSYGVYCHLGNVLTLAKDF